MDVTLDLRDLDQKPYTLEILIHQGTVELHHRNRLVVTMLREVLRAYISTPIGEFVYDNTRWIEHNNDVWLCIGNQVAQPLTGPQLAELRSKL